MKTWLIALTAVLLGLVVGTAASLRQIGFPGSGDPMDRRGLFTDSPRELNPLASQGGPATVVVSLIENGKRRQDKTTIDFGIMPAGNKKSAEFIFHNSGKGVLQLQHLPESSCTCIRVGRFDASVEPGGETVVKIEWDTTQKIGKFTENITIRTNDDNCPRVILKVDGRVTQGLTVFPKDLPFGSVGARDAKSLSFQITAYSSSDLKIEDCQVIGASDSQRWEISPDRMSKEQLDELSDGAKSGYNVTVTLKPGLPLGAFQWKILVTTNLFDAREVPISGTIVPDITVSQSSPGWISKKQVLNLGRFASKAGSGKFKTLFLMVRGPQRNDIRIKVKQTFPQIKVKQTSRQVIQEVIQATLGKPLKLKSLVRWPIRVHIPKGQPAMNHRQAGNYGKIVLETTHQDISEREVVIHVSFEVTP